MTQTLYAWLLILFCVVAALAMHYAMERIERREERDDK